MKSVETEHAEQLNRYLRAHPAPADPPVLDLVRTCDGCLAYLYDLLLGKRRLEACPLPFPALSERIEALLHWAHDLDPIRLVPDGDCEDLPDPDQDPMASLDLTPEDRRLIDLYRFDPNLSMCEIGERVGLPEAEVQARVEAIQLRVQVELLGTPLDP